MCWMDFFMSTFRRDKRCIIVLLILALNRQYYLLFCLKTPAFFLHFKSRALSHSVKYNNKNILDQVSIQLSLEVPSRLMIADTEIAKSITNVSLRVQGMLMNQSHLVRSAAGRLCS